MKYKFEIDLAAIEYSDYGNLRGFFFNLSHEIGFGPLKVGDKGIINNDWSYTPPSGSLKTIAKWEITE